MQTVPLEYLLRLTRMHLVDQTFRLPADAACHVDCWKMALLGKRTREQNVTVEQRFHKLTNRIVDFVGFAQYRHDRGNRAARLQRSATLDELRNGSKHIGGVGANGRRLARSETDLAKRHRQARDGIQDEKNVPTLRAPIFR